MVRQEAITAAAVSRESRERRRRRKEKMLSSKQSLQNTNFSIRNFRPVPSFQEAKIYRCGSTDVLGAKIHRCLSKTETETETETETDRNFRRRLRSSWSEADTMVLEDAGFLLDLRSPPERREDDAQRWMNMNNEGLLSLLPRNSDDGSGSKSNSNSGENSTSTTRQQSRRHHRPIRLVTIPVDGAAPSEDIFDQNNNNNNNTIVEDSRYVIRLDVLNRPELLGYVREKWLSSTVSSSAAASSSAVAPYNDRIEEANKIMIELNRRGLAGLNEAILETRSGQKGMCLALQLMTLYRETVAPARNSNDDHDDDNEYNKHETITAQNRHSIVFHCVQGKDRTGMLAMLMQILAGCSDEIIVEDYYRSNAEFVRGTSASSSSNETTSAAASAMAARGDNNDPISNNNNNNNNNRRTIVRMDGNVFRGTNRPAMVATLKGLRFRHGRSLEGYFDRIGFDASWRMRFVAVFGDSRIPPSSRL